MNRLTNTLAIAALAAVSLGTSAVAASAAPTVRAGSAADPAGLTPTRDAYRADLGGGTTAGQNGSFGGVRREINWDGVPEAQSSPNPFSADFFNTNSPRGAVFATPGSGFQVSSNADPKRFGNLNANYTATFQTFSPQKLFTPIGSNVTDVKFFVPGTTKPASVTGFGSVFADVDAANATSITYYDEDGKKVDTISAPVADGGLSFLGATYTDGTRISRVRIATGNTTVGPDDGGAAADVVVMDDFLYGEPQEIAAKPAPGQPAGDAGQPGPANPGPAANLAGNNETHVPPALRASVRRALTLAALKRGVKAKANCSTACSLRFSLLRGGKVLASKRLGVGTGTRTATLRPHRRALAHAPVRFALRLRVTATDQTGDATTRTARIGVRS
jgi:hypothetical protein